jgi:acylphosphatase
VGFRFMAVDLAMKHEAVGWVKNISDGRVELIAEGEEPLLLNFLAEIKRVLGRYIAEVKLSWEPATGQFKDFSIEF